MRYIHRPSPDASLLEHPFRRQLLQLLFIQPLTAAALARILACPGQRVRYHLRQLEGAMLVNRIRAPRHSRYAPTATGRLAHRLDPADSTPMAVLGKHLANRRHPQTLDDVAAATGLERGQMVHAVQALLSHQWATMSEAGVWVFIRSTPNGRRAFSASRTRLKPSNLARA